MIKQIDQATPSWTNSSYHQLALSKLFVGWRQQCGFAVQEAASKLGVENSELVDFKLSENFPKLISLTALSRSLMYRMNLKDSWINNLESAFEVKFE